MLVVEIGDITGKITSDNIIRKMLHSEEVWNTVSKFLENILHSKKLLATP